MDGLEGTALFQGMDRAQIDGALAVLAPYERAYRRGEIVSHAGSPTASMGLVLSGSVTIERVDVWGDRTILALVGPGEIFAEAYALLGDRPMLVDAAANEDCRVLFLAAGRLMDPAAPAGPWQAPLLRNILRIVSRKDLALSQRSFHTAPKTARGRIMAYLDSVSLAQGRRSFDIPFDRQQMADYLALDRTALSKELGRMRAEGIIDFRKNHFTIRQGP